MRDTQSAAILEFPNSGIQGANVDQEEIDRILAMVEQYGEEVLTVEELEILDQVSEQLPDPSEHDANLAEYLDENTLNKIAQDVIQWVEWDDESRDEWKQREARAIRMMGISENTEGGAKFKGASRVVHPLLAEACVQYNARAIQELWPPEGPVKTKIIGKSNDERQEQAERVRGYMNYQYTEEMPGAYDAEDRLQLRLPLSGSVFVKLYTDPITGKAMREFVDPNYFVVPYTANCLRTAPRYTHIIPEGRNAVLKKMYNGYYRKVNLDNPYEDSEETGGTQAVQDEVDSTEGRHRVSVSEDQRHTNLEMHVEYDVPGFEHTDEQGKPTGVGLPYVITVNKDSQKVLAIRRNWREGDNQLYEKRIWFAHRKFLPGLGFYGYGFIHIIGGLSRAATGALRALLDSAHFSNMQGGFRSKDAKIPDGNTVIAPGEWPEVDTAMDDLKKAFLPLAYKEPSEALFKLLGLLGEMGQRFAFITDNVVGEASNTAPVGTTIALIEQGLKVYSSIHKRQHQGMGEEFKILAEINGEYLPDEYPYEVEEEERVILRQDFDGRIDIVPVSDPNIVTTTQRIGQAQGILQLSDSAPDLYNRREAHKRMLLAMRVEDIDELLVDQSQVPHQGPIEENMAMTMMNPVRAYIDQDHQAHLIVHQMWFERLDPETQKRVEAAFFAHQAEHMAMQYQLQMMQLLGQDIPIGQPVPPEIENQIAQAAAQAVQLMPPVSNDQDPKALEAVSDQQRKDWVAQREQDRKDQMAKREILRKDFQTEATIAAQLHKQQVANNDRNGSTGIQ